MIKPGIPLLWLTLFHPIIYLTNPEADDFSIPVVDWLWELNLQLSFEARGDFRELLRSFLQDPRRCHHLSVGKARSVGHFAHLCAQTVLDNYLSTSAQSKNKRCPLFMFFFYTAYVYARVIVYLHKILSTILNHFCVHRHLDANEIEKCIRVRNDISPQE